MGKQTNDVRLVAFFESLTADLKDTNPCTVSIQQTVERQLERMRKKAVMSGQTQSDRAVQQFLECNESLTGVQVQLSSDVIECARDYLLYILEKHCKKYDPDSLQESYTWDQLMDHWAYGKGTSNGITGSGTLEKIHQPMSVTKTARPLVKSLRLRDPYFRSFDAANGNDGLVEVSGSRLDTVPKNETIDRTIAIEPSGNMALQLAAGRVIEGALRMIGLDITTQEPKNKSLARKGSLDGSLCTIDLKMASDRILPELVRLIWPPEWYELLMQLRSPVIMVRGRVVELKMISTMGNGFTFPLMTMTILMLIYANRRINHSGPYRFVDWSCTAVYGDDIIIPTAEYDTLSERLGEAGLVVNHDKSYHTGAFRESCGGDFYNGYNITPFYVKSLQFPADIYVAINQLLGWLGTHYLCAPRALLTLFAMLDGKAFFVPEWMQDTAGVRTAQCEKRYKHLKLVQTWIPYEGFMQMRLACGGFLRSQDGLHVGQRRESHQRYVVGDARLPNFCLDGWDPLTRTQSQSSHISYLLSMVRLA